ncbi:Hypothetical predicted protein [Pelobates cultripes]|uniref:Uncharacterized protein n=1 Tax=Pelobates cultripes TaxID=61616 RepID=A0AAD1TBJ9_PELCU|nr:Hypothetical predicted protein [Pelobates cultripes]
MRRHRQWRNPRKASKHLDISDDLLYDLAAVALWGTLEEAGSVLTSSKVVYYLLGNAEHELPETLARQIMNTLLGCRDITCRAEAELTAHCYL